MLVNPQSFNYRFIKSGFVIVIAVFGVLGYLKYQSIEAQQVFSEQENKLIKHELAEVLKQNEQLNGYNNTVLNQLDQAEVLMQKAEDSITELTHNLSVLKGIKVENNRLRQQLASVETRLAQANNEILELQTQQEVANAVNNASPVTEARLSTSFIAVKGFETHAAARFSTYKSNRINNLEVCFNIAENAIIAPGMKDIYIQIIKPDNQILAKKGSISRASTPIVYSYKTNVEYYNTNTKVCVAVEADKEDKPLQEGTYKVNIYNNDTLIGSTEIFLE